MSFLRRAVWKMAIVVGGPSRRWSWNDQYRRGRWNGISGARSEIMMGLLREFARGRILELGCGEGSLCAALPPFTEYLGVDISSSAIAMARQKVEFRPCSFQVSDMMTFRAAGLWSLIIIEEALYYLSTSNQTALLERCRGMLAANGVVLVAIHSGEKHASTITTCRASNVVREIANADRVYFVISN